MRPLRYRETGYTEIRRHIPAERTKKCEQVSRKSVCWRASR